MKWFKIIKNIILIFLGLFSTLGAILLVTDDVSGTVFFGVIAIICFYFSRRAIKAILKILRNKKIKIILIIVTLVIIVFVLIFFAQKDYKLNPSEAVAYTGLRLVIAQSAYDGGGSLSEENFEILGGLIKNIDGVWFGKTGVIYYGKNIDTSENQVTIISDGDYTATFVIRDTEGEYELLEYNFEKSYEKGYKFIVH